MASKLSLRLFLPLLTPLFGMTLIVLVLGFLLVILMLIFPSLEQQIDDVLFGRRRTLEGLHRPPPRPPGGPETRPSPSPPTPATLGPDGRPSDPGLRERFDRLRRILQQPRPGGDAGSAQVLRALNADSGGEVLTLALAQAVRPGEWAPSPQGWVELSAALEQHRGADLQAEVRRLVDQAPPLVRPTLLRALGQYGDLQDQEKLLHFVHSQDALERLAATQALGQVRGPAGLEQLLGLLGDADVRVRAEARRALDQYKDPETLKRLKAEAQTAADGPARKLAQDYARTRLKELNQEGKP